MEMRKGMPRVCFSRSSSIPAQKEKELRVVFQIPVQILHAAARSNPRHFQGHVRSCPFRCACALSAVRVLHDVLSSYSWRHKCSLDALAMPAWTPQRQTSRSASHADSVHNKKRHDVFHLSQAPETELMALSYEPPDGKKV